MYGNTMSMVNKQIGKYAPDAAKVIETQLDRLKSKYPGIFSDQNLTSLTSLASGGNIEAPGAAPGGRHARANALGGIFTRPTYFHSGRDLGGEAGVEALIPLNERGQAFMAGMIARSLAQGIHMAMPAQQSGPSVVNEDHSTNYTGDIKVTASDPMEMERKLKQRKRLKQLSSAGRRHS
jgi:hypothetical protein